jgi:hypothetical protein
MALDPQKDLKTIQQLNAEIDSLYKRLGRQDTPPIFDAGKISSARREITKLNEDLNEVNSSLSFISKSFRDSIAELSKQNTELGYAKRSLRNIESISRSIAYENSQGLLISDKTLNSLEKKAKLEYQSLKIAVDSGRIKGAELKEFQENLKTAEEFERVMSRIRNQTQMVKDDMGVKTFSFFDDLTSKIPGLAALSEPFKAAREEAERAGKANVELFGQSKPLQKKQLDALKEAAKTGKGLTQDKIKELGLEKLLTSQTGKTLSGKVASQAANKLLGSASSAAGQSAVSPMMAGLKSIGPAISNMLKKALGPIALLKELFDAIVASDAAVADMAKNFGMTYDEAYGLKTEMTSIATASGDTFVTSKGILETYTAINGALGTNAMLSEDMAVSFTKLREKAGFTNEELQGIARIQLGTKNTTEDITGQFLAQAKVSSLKNGVIMNEQKMLKEIGKVSAATTLSLGKNPGLIGQAVATAKSLGMELSQVDAIAGSLLDFESSIENELSAELLLNKDLNLEKARQAALNNDLATVAEEIANQVGSSAEFTEMNRIQQEALAKSVGMSREDLAETLLLQDQLKGLTADAAAEETKKFEQLKGQVGEQEAMRILQEQGVAGLDKQVGMADKLNAQMEKLKEIFVIVGEALMPILDIFVSLFDLIGPLMKFLDPVIQTTLVAVGALKDLFTGIAWVVNHLFGGDMEFGDSATKKQVQKAEASSQKNYGFSGDAYGDDWAIKDRTEMAAGGIVTGPTNALVGEAGPEAVIPLSGNSPSIKVDNSETNSLLRQLIKKTPEMAPLGLYEVQ